MAAGWYCKVMGELLGPMPLKQVIELARDGSLLPDDMVRKKTGEWVVASDVRGLFPDEASEEEESDETPVEDAEPDEASASDTATEEGGAA